MHTRNQHARTHARNLVRRQAGSIVSVTDTTRDNAVFACVLGHTSNARLTRCARGGGSRGGGGVESGNRSLAPALISLKPIAPNACQCVACVACVRGVHWRSDSARTRTTGWRWRVPLTAILSAFRISHSSELSTGGAASCVVRASCARANAACACERAQMGQTDSFVTALEGGVDGRAAGAAVAVIVRALLARMLCR